MIIKKWLIGILMFMAVVIIALFAYYHSEPSIEKTPVLKIGDSYSEITEHYGQPYVTYGKICMWKNTRWVALGCFSPDNVLEQFGVYDVHHRYVYGTLDNNERKAVNYKCITQKMQEMPNAYETGSGYSEYGVITRSGVIVYGTSFPDLHVIDPNNPPYSDTPLLIYLLTHPISSLL